MTKYKIGFSAFFLAIFLWLIQSALAVEPIKISAQDTALDISRAVAIHHNNSKTFQIAAAPGPDGIVRRIEVQANNENNKGNWAVFAIANPTDEQFDRLIVAPHYRLAGSGLLHPDLGSTRIQSITPSEGFALDRQTSADSDVFRITINPGAVITFVAELGSPSLPQIYLWEPEAYKDTLNSYTLYNGILLGISGLLALLLAILFVVRGTSLFPATAAVAWSVLAYIGVDFHFVNKIFAIEPATEPLWRAGTEVALAASLFIFLFTYLNLNRWHYRFSYGAAAWIIALCALGGFSIYDPTLAAGIARISVGLTACLGIVLIGYFAVHGYDRAIMLIPTWLLIIFWILGAFACVTGRLDNDIVQPALAGGLVLIVLLIGFTVMQHAFSAGAFQQGLFSDLERQALAVIGAGDTVWDWDVPRDRIVINPDLSVYLGSSAGHLSGTVRNWLNAMHPDDRDKFLATLDFILDTKKGRIDQEFRLRSGDGHYHWFTLHARPVIGSDGEIIRCVGTLINITDHKKAEERLLHDSIHDNLTGLPNKQLFIDRLQNSANLALIDQTIRPTVIVIDFDGFRHINHAFGMSVGDTFLLTISKRLSRLIKPQDTLSRLSADRFGIILNTLDDPTKIAVFAESLKTTITAPINFSQRNIKLTASIGLVTWTDGNSNAEEILNDAELAMIYAKRNGGNTIEPFRPNLRSLNLDRSSLQKDLQKALEREEIRILYHPVLNLSEGDIVGFEAFTAWEHPRYGTLSMLDFISAAENNNFILPLGKFALESVAKDLTRLQDRFPKKDFFISFNLPSPDLICQEFVNDIRSVLVRNPFKPGRLMIEVSEAILMDNPEQSAALLERIKTLGFGLALDNFGTGYSSLAFLVRFPFDMMKLDRSLLSDDTTKKRRLILHSVVDMAHNFDLKVIADGVETEADAIMLRELGCEFVQSIVFTEPVDFLGLIDLIENHPEAGKQQSLP